MPEPGSRHSLTEGDRQEAIARLRERYMAGNLKLGEYEARVDRIIDATSSQTVEAALGNLATDTATLPARTGLNRDTVSAVLCSRTLRGSWTVAPEMAAVAILGQVTLDLRDANFEDDVTEIHVVCALGEISIIVPPKLNVQVDVQAVLGGVKQKKLPRRTPGGPLVVITGYAVLGEVAIVTKSRPPAPA